MQNGGCDILVGHFVIPTRPNHTPTGGEAVGSITSGQRFGPEVLRKESWRGGEGGGALPCLPLCNSSGGKLGAKDSRSAQVGKSPQPYHVLHHFFSLLGFLPFRVGHRAIWFAKSRLRMRGQRIGSLKAQ